MVMNNDRSDLQSKLEFIIKENPNSIIIIDKRLVLKEIIVAKDELFDALKKIGLGKTFEEVFTDEKTRLESLHFQKTVDRVLTQRVELTVSCEINFRNKGYRFEFLIKPYEKDLVIIYARNLDSLKKYDDSHELINTILDHLPLGVCVKDVEDNFNYLYWNRFMEEISGLKNKTVRGHDDFEIDYDALLSKEERRVLDKDIIKTGKAVEMSGIVKIASGEYRNVEVTKFPVSLSNGKPLLLALWRDVTAKLKIEDILKRTQTLTKMALHSNDIRTYSCYVNPQSAVDYEDTLIQLHSWNSDASEWIDVSLTDFLSRIYPDDLSRYKETFVRLCKGDVQEVKVEIRLYYPKVNDYRWREFCSYVYERDEAGRPLALLGCSTNIQERKYQEINLEEAKHKAELADKMKSKYLADMSHEIRTPLNAITGFAELMAFTDSDEERMSYYDIIKTNNQLLMQLINDILDLSKIEADAIKISYDRIDVNELMDSTFASVRLRMPEGVELRLEKGLTECYFGTDHIRLLQLINNLANNAIKNTKKGSITMGYTCLKENRLKFYVKDTGVGIAPDKLDNLFNRFVKVNDYVEGIGLGLAICQGLVTKMGGTISVESELGVGSTFSFILPSHL